MTDAPDPFDAPPAAAAPAASEAMIVDIEGFEGPLDLLLTLARTQKVDLRQLSILALAEQYLAVIDRARDLRIELAADWLVMAAWLAWLKSRLLLPPDPEAEGPSADEIAEALALRLQRLEALRGLAARLMARDRLGQDRFARGAPEAVARTRDVVWRTGLADLMSAYARLRTRDQFRPLAFDREGVWTMEQALERLGRMLGAVPAWTDLAAFLPQGLPVRSATAATFAAALELARQGRLELRQAEVFAPLQLRAT